MLTLVAVGIFLMACMGATFFQALGGVLWYAACMVIVYFLGFLPHIVLVIGFPIYFIVSYKLGGSAMMLVNAPFIIIYICNILF